MSEPRIAFDIKSSKPFTYEEALCIQIEGVIADMNQSNHELMDVLKRVHGYLAEKGKGGASEEDVPPHYQIEEERT